MMANPTAFCETAASFANGHVNGICPADVDAFLEQTQGTDITAGQRLRLLAIALERRSSGQRQWPDLHVIYSKAAELAPDQATVFHSWGISATDWIDSWRTPELSRRLEIASEAERSLLRAMELAPRNSHFAHSLGLFYYQHPLRETDKGVWLDKAITWFGRAADWQPDRYRVIAQLYLAHCHHDRKDWPSAINAYEKVDRAMLAQEWPRWRAVKCREQLAHCYAMSGQIEEAVRQFSDLLDELESLDDTIAEDWIINLEELVEAVTHPIDDPILLRRTQALATRLGYEARYPELFVSSDQ